MILKILILVVFVVVTTIAFSAEPQKTGMIIDEHKLVEISKFDLYHDGSLEFLKEYIQPIRDSLGRDWPEMKPRVLPQSAIIPQRKPANRPPKGFERKTLYQTVELDSSIYSLRKLNSKVINQSYVEDYAVERDGEIVYSFTAKCSVTGRPVKTFFAWNGDWIIEHYDHVIVSGCDLNDELGYEKTYNYRIINGEPFYFFEQEGVVKLSYSGVVQPARYNRVAHYLCCEPGILNPKISEYYIGFLAARDGWWYYVEAGVMGEK